MFIAIHKKLLVLLLSLMLLIFTYGCSSETSQAEYNKVIEENKALKAQINNLQETESVKITGSFTASVRDIIPNYVLDNVTPSALVLTCFQSTPFVVTVSPKTASKIKVGETYHFKLNDTLIGDISKSEFKNQSIDIHTAIYVYNVKIESFRLPKENEYGLNWVNVKLEKV